MDPALIVPRDLDFLLWEWLRLDRLLTRPEFLGHDRGTVTAVFDLSVQLASDLFLPHYKDADRDEPRLDDEGTSR